MRAEDCFGANGGPARASHKTETERRCRVSPRHGLDGQPVGPVLGPAAEKRALIEYLGYELAPSDTADSAPRRPRTAPYEFVGYERWRDSSGFPAIQPPWGRSARSTSTAGIPLEDSARRVRCTHGARDRRHGNGQYGGPIVTRGGLVFIAATQDAKFRAFDKRTGRLLWKRPSPRPATPTPSTFAVRGRQFVVVAAGGGNWLEVE